MNLAQLRQQFKTISGRYDLVNPDGSDNGADFYINEGRKFLDGLDETQKSWASYFRWLQAGLWSVQVPDCRAIKEVWAATSTARWQLEKLSLQDMIASYITSTPEQLTAGETLYYSPAVTRYIPENATCDTFESFIGYVHIPSGNAEKYNSIIMAPPTSEKLVIEIKGLFWSMELVSETDKNYWSVAHPMLLIQAAMMQLEIVNRNTQGVNDWKESILTAMNLLGNDLVEELIAEVDNMEA